MFWSLFTSRKPDEVSQGKIQGTDNIPPSEALKREFNKNSEKIFEEKSCQELAKKVLLKPSEVLCWLEHLRSVKEHRKEGARKAAETRRQKRRVRIPLEYKINSYSTTLIDPFFTYLMCCMF
jgi:hypothetical protein